MLVRERQDTMDNYLICPFCLNHSVEPKPGKTICPECSTEFELDDRLECIFVNPKTPKLPMNGLICASCGLVQGTDKRRCVYCGAELSTTVQ